jgi:hypothetical protein
MSRGVKYLIGSLAVVALIALAGCGHYWYAEREPWRRDAEIACLNSGTVKETPERVRISPISGPGMCGADFPIRVTALGDSSPLGFGDEDEPIRPPGGIPDASMPRWPAAVESSAPPAPTSATPLPPPSRSPVASTPIAPIRPYPPAPGRPNSSAPAPASAGQPLSLTPPGGAASGMASSGMAPPSDEDDEEQYRRLARRPYRAPPQPPATSPPRGTGAPSFGPVRAPGILAANGPVAVTPVATLACPIVAALDQWITAAVQPAAIHWFRTRVVEIKQISAYSCRGMNGNSNAHISEHAFGNALDIAEFVLADGHRVTVQYGWRGSPEEQAFLHDVQLAACNTFNTVLAPGANVYHYNHIHVDLMRRSSGRRICEPAAIPGEVVAQRIRSRYAAQHFGDTGVTGSIKPSAHRPLIGHSIEDDDRLPAAEPGDD